MFPGISDFGGLSGGGATGGISRAENTGDIIFNAPSNDFFKDDNNFLTVGIIAAALVGAIWLLKKKK